MHSPTPAALRVRVAAGGLTLAVHGLLLVVLVLEDRDLLRPVPAARRLTGMWIQLPVTPASAQATATARSTSSLRNIDEALLARNAPALAPAPAAAPASPPASAPAAAPDVPAAAAEPGIAAGIDWELAAQQRLAKAAEGPATFSPPLQAMRKPCTPRSYDQATAALMDELLPPPRDLPIGGGTGQKSVQMGGTRVGVVLLVGGRSVAAPPDDSRKSSFKWKWDHKSTGGAGLTLGWSWEQPPKYDGMFNDMKAGKTPDSSVPHPETCD